ncbi:hypothetical protein EOM86_11495, partial [Candidatus Nomurabacteria bacterium]|nr:hypothetical protein [Candidatus Nomurabacteria bacterium]
MPKLPIGDVFAEIIYFLSDALRELFDLIRLVVMSVVEGIEAALDFVPFWGVAILIAVLAYFLSGKGLALFSFAGVFLIANMGLWDQTISTLAIIITSTMISLLVGIPVGILSAKFEPANKVIRPVLDFMQTMPAFVYLIPAVFFFNEDEFQALIPDLDLTTAGISLEEAYILAKDYLRAYCSYAVKFNIEIEDPSTFNKIREQFKNQPNAVVMLID